MKSSPFSPPQRQMSQPRQEKGATRMKRSYRGIWDFPEETPGAQPGLMASYRLIDLSTFTSPSLLQPGSILSLGRDIPWPPMHHTLVTNGSTPAPLTGSSLSPDTANPGMQPDFQTHVPDAILAPLSLMTYAQPKLSPHPSKSIIFHHCFTQLSHIRMGSTQQPGRVCLLSCTQDSTQDHASQ